MRSLNLLFGKQVKASTFQIIWEVWFTVSIITFLILALLATMRSEWISEGTLYIVGFHALASTIVGVTTHEKLTA